MKLSEVVNEQTTADLREAMQRGEFPGVSFEQAMEFLLTDGIIPASGLPVDSFLRLEEWALRQSAASQAAAGS